MAANKSLALALGVIPNTVSLRKKTQNKASYIWLTGVGLDTWASGKPGALFSHVAAISSLRISPLSALGLVPLPFHANCSWHPAGPHSTAGSGSSMFSCQTKSSLSNIAGPIFLFGLRTGSNLYREIGSLRVEEQGLGRYSWL